MIVDMFTSLHLSLSTMLLVAAECSAFCVLAVSTFDLGAMKCSIALHLIPVQHLVFTSLHSIFTDGQGSLQEALQQAKTECVRLSNELKTTLAATSDAEQKTEERSKEMRGLKDELDATRKQCTKMQRTINRLADSLSAVQVCLTFHL